ncbi:MAG: hydrogenase maturation protease [Cyanobacteria bacterium RI_101]|nr:hydrogenase maturation protease [Cyanobacteria bacterium RI_101]
MERLGVIGYGNTLRSDDGAGYRLAERLQGEAWPGVAVLACHQLTPELAADLAQWEKVVFLDAGLQSSPLVIVESLTPAPGLGTLGHSSDPRELLRLSQWLYGKAPEAWWLKLATVNLELGETLSPLTEKAQLEALALTRSLLS